MRSSIGKNVHTDEMHEKRTIFCRWLNKTYGRYLTWKRLFSFEDTFCHIFLLWSFVRFLPLSLSLDQMHLSMSTKTFRALNRLSLASEQRRFRNDEIPWEGKKYIYWNSQWCSFWVAPQFCSSPEIEIVEQLCNWQTISLYIDSIFFFENVTINLLRTK